MVMFKSCQFFFLQVIHGVVETLGAHTREFGTPHRRLMTVRVVVGGRR